MVHVIQNKMQVIFTNIVKCDKLAKQLEEGDAYNYTIKEANSRKVMTTFDNTYFKLIYQDRSRMIWLHLKNHPEQIEDLKSGNISIVQFSDYTHQEFAPNLWKPYIERKMTIDKNKV